MRETTPEPASRRALHDALVAEIEELAARIRELTAQIEVPGGRRPQQEDTRENVGA